MRIITALTDWTFTRTDPGVGDDTADEAVTLPHAWNTSPGGVPAPDDRGPGWYRCRMTAPSAPSNSESDGARTFVAFGAAGTVADVWCNELHLGQHRGGYSAFLFDCTDALDADGCGELLVRVDNSPTGDVYPLMGDHTIFGGLYRGAQLVTVPGLHIDVADHGGPGVWTRVSALDDAAATVAVHVRVANASAADTTCDVEITVTDDEGAAVAAAATSALVGAGATEAVAVQVTIPEPRRWDGRDDPYRYSVTARVGDDEVTIPLGLRDMRIDPDEGFLLNGRPYALRGVSRHHDICGTPAVTDDEIALDFDLIDEIGANAVRLAHYQHAEAVLDECDRRGIVVWAEIPVNSKVSATDPTTNAAAQLFELIRQQRHHPSIACWGIQNESVISEALVDPRPLVVELVELARAEDPDRPTAQAQLALVAPDDPINRLCDLNGVNLYHGWYFGEATGVGEALDGYRAANPDIALGLSEYGADATTAFHAAAPTAGDYTEEYQAVFHEIYLRQIHERPWLWSTFVWNMFDFASAIRDEGGTVGYNSKGLVARDRAIRKDAYYVYKANWSTEPMVHVCSKRFVNRSGDSMVVKVYSNQPVVSLQVNGTDLGEQTSEDRTFTWEVPLSEEVSVVAASGDVRDEATFHQVDADDPTYVCDEPRRAVTAGRMDSWYEEQGIVLDRSGFGFWSLLGELLDNPETRAILVDLVGEEMLNHPQIEIGRNFTLELVLGAVTDLEPERIAELQTRLGAVTRPAG